MTTTGSAVREFRTVMGLTLRELAETAEVNPGYLSQFERGLVEPNARWIKSVTDALGRRIGGAA